SGRLAKRRPAPGESAHAAGHFTAGRERVPYHAREHCNRPANSFAGKQSPEWEAPVPSCGRRLPRDSGRAERSVRLIRRRPDARMSASDTSQAALAGYDRLIRRRLLLLAVMTCGIAISFVVDLASGPSRLPIADVLAALRGTAAADAPASIIVWEIRLPAAIMATLVGAALALAGAEMQTTLDNALASPFTLGMASAATFGAALWIVAGLSVPGIPDDWMLPLNAFLCALGSVFLLQAAARSRQAGPETLVLFGIALFFTFNALVAILQFVASDQALQQLVFWTMGSLSRADWTTIRLLGLALVVVVPFAMMAAWK